MTAYATFDREQIRANEERRIEALNPIPTYLVLAPGLRIIARKTMPKNANCPRPALRIAPAQGDVVNAVGRRCQYTLLSLIRTEFTKPRITKWQAVACCSAFAQLWSCQNTLQERSMSEGMPPVCGLLSTQDPVFSIIVGC